ncbi:beta-1,3-galactosyltransferase 1-like [Patiria miniata]|uniref:Hexosyltransferase n=1 Tax=Patiria miniata TaxID=46514 RepID=A0A914A9Q6_PATMI|nr:beta-1,3-galactosyltransferase 1-like [Patiria miniata]
MFFEQQLNQASVMKLQKLFLILTFAVALSCFAFVAYVSSRGHGSGASRHRTNAKPMRYKLGAIASAKNISIKKQVHKLIGKLKDIRERIPSKFIKSKKANRKDAVPRPPEIVNVLQTHKKTQASSLTRTNPRGRSNDVRNAKNTILNLKSARNSPNIYSPYANELSRFDPVKEASKVSIPSKLTALNIPNRLEETKGFSTVHIGEMHNTNLETSVILSSPDRDDTRRVINPHGYKLLMDEPQACYDATGTPKEVFLLVFIATIHAHTEQRQAIRETWGSPREVMGKKIVTLFLLAQNQYVNLQQQVEEESNKHHDILQEDFQDTYKNLTLKTIMAMKWASTHCPHASYVMKTDDDSYVSYDNLVKHLTRSPSINYAVGRLFPSAAPFRNPSNKWYVSKETYPRDIYPPFLAGTGYVLSTDVAGKVFQMSLRTKYIHLEDIFVALCLESLHIIPVKGEEFHNFYIEYSRSRYCNLITSHQISPLQMRRIWSSHPDQGPC